MAARLQMKLGFVAEQDRLPDSPDTIVVVEPTVSGIARSKGQLYLLVTSRVSSRGAAEATRIAAETIRNEYYYDESAAISVCIEKAIGSVNKRLHHQRDRLGLGPQDRDGPIGIGLAVVRGNELYVATAGPAEAYLIRQARLSVLPDPNRERGLPARELRVDVWRGEANTGDSLVLISPNVVGRLGPDELKDAAVTLHPQSAVEHLHGRFVAGGGSGSDGAIALEATEGTDGKKRVPVPVRPEALRGQDAAATLLSSDADGASGRVPVESSSSVRVYRSPLSRGLATLGELLPNRQPAHRRARPQNPQRESQRRGAVAVLAFILVVGALGVGVFLLGGGVRREPAPAVSAGQRSLDNARAAVDQVFAPGADLFASDPNRAKSLLTGAWHELDRARDAGISAAAIAPLRARVTGGLDRVFGVIQIVDAVIATFDPAANPPFDLRAAVRGPDGNPYVLDAATKAVYRIDIKTKKPAALLRAGAKAAGSTPAAPMVITSGGPDVLVVDAKDTVWRWRIDSKGRGTLSRIHVAGSGTWGDDLRAMGTFVIRQDTGIYNLYVVDPSARQILSYAPAIDGRGFPSGSSSWLDSPKDVDALTAMYVDGDIFVVDGGQVVRYVGGNPQGWSARPPGDDLLRPAPHYRLVASPAERRSGLLYAYDDANARIIAFDKANGNYREQYRLAGDGAGLRDVRGMYVLAAAGAAPPTLVWATSNEIHQAPLATAPSGNASPAPSGSAGPSGSPGASGSPAPSGSAAASASVAAASR